MKFIDHFDFNKQGAHIKHPDFEEIEKLKSYKAEPNLKNSWKIMLIGLIRVKGYLIF